MTRFIVLMYSRMHAWADERVPPLRSFPLFYEELPISAPAHRVSK